MLLKHLNRLASIEASLHTQYISREKELNNRKEIHKPPKSMTPLDEHHTVSLNVFQLRSHCQTIKQSLFHFYRPLGGRGLETKRRISLRYECGISHLSRDMGFPTMWYVRPAQAQTSLRIRAV